MSCTTDRRLIFTAVPLRKPTRFVGIHRVILGRDLLVAQLFCRLDLNLAPSSSPQLFFPDFEVPYSTPFTTAVATAPSVCSPWNGVPSPVDLPTLRPERTALLVSSTSWTADEDFGLLLEALVIYNDRAASMKGVDKGLPRILVMITGKGPLRDVYMEKIQRLQRSWDFVRCISAWLDTPDYPLLLGSLLAFLIEGRIDELQYRICRHRNIPPYQFFGTGFTHENCRHVWVRSSRVCAGFRMVSQWPEFHSCHLTEVDPPSLQELVRPGWNGLIFKSSEELANQLIVCPQSLAILLPLLLLSVTESSTGVPSFSKVGNAEIFLWEIARFLVGVIRSSI